MFDNSSLHLTIRAVDYTALIYENDIYIHDSANVTATLVDDDGANLYLRDNNYYLNYCEGCSVSFHADGWSNYGFIQYNTLYLSNCSNAKIIIYAQWYGVIRYNDFIFGDNSRNIEIEQTADIFILLFCPVAVNVLYTYQV